MNITGHSEIEDVGYSTTSPSIEVLSLGELRARVQPQRNLFLRPQRVNFDLLVVCDAGTLRHTVDFVEYLLRPGDLLWVRAGQVQEWEWFDADAPRTPTVTNPEEVAGTIILFEPTQLDERARALGGWSQPRCQWTQATSDGSIGRRRLDDLVDTAARALPPESREELVARVLGIFIAELAFADPAVDAARRPPDDLFGSLIVEIDANFATTRNTGDYARQLGYSTRTLNRSAIRNTGLTVKQLVDQRALLEAKRLLAHDTAPVQAVGRAVGFPEPTTFTRFFRHRTGVTPMEFRFARTAAN